MSAKWRSPRELVRAAGSNRQRAPTTTMPMGGIEAVSSIKEIWMYAHRMIRSARQIINAELRPLGLSSAEGNILLHLLMGDSEMPQEQLADELDIGKAAISRAIDSLEAKGYVMRKARPADKRAYLVALTEKAAAIGPAIESAYNHVFDIVRRGISDEEYDRIVLIISQIAGNLSDRQLSQLQETRSQEARPKRG